MKNVIITLQICTMLVGIWFMALGSDYYIRNVGAGNMLIAGSILFSAGLLGLSITNRER